MFDLVLPFVSPFISAELATEPWQLEGYRALRRRVFCEEQRLFDQDDADEHDTHAVAIVALVVGVSSIVTVVRIGDSGAHAVWGGGV